MLALIMLQRANGSWEMSSQLEQVIGSDGFRPGLRIADATPLLRDFHNVWATALAIAWLERQADHFRSEWEMVADKGRHWLHHAVRELGNGERWVHEAARFL